MDFDPISGLEEKTKCQSKGGGRFTICSDLLDVNITSFHTDRGPGFLMERLRWK